MHQRGTVQSGCAVINRRLVPGFSVPCRVLLPSGKHCTARSPEVRDNDCLLERQFVRLSPLVQRHRDRCFPLGRSTLHGTTEAGTRRRLMTAHQIDCAALCITLSWEREGGVCYEILVTIPDTLTEHLQPEEPIRQTAAARLLLEEAVAALYRAGKLTKMQAMAWLELEAS